MRFQGYAPASVQTQLATTCPHPNVGSTGGLPFTGFDLGLVATVAALIIVMGMMLRRAGRDKRK